MLDNLIAVLFRNTYNALIAYSESEAELKRLDWPGPGAVGMKQIRTVRHQRFCALWDVIEQAGLVEEYEVWKQGIE